MNARKSHFDTGHLFDCFEAKKIYKGMIVLLDSPGREKLIRERASKPGSESLFNILIGLVFALIVAALAMIAWQMMSEAPAPRTSAERDLARYQDLVKTKPRDPLAHAGMGSALMQVGSYGQAVKYFKKAINLRPADPRYRIEIAKAYIAQDETKAALTSLGKAKKLDENSEDAWFEEGNIYFKQQQYKKAIKSLLKSSEIQPSASDTHYLLAQAFEKTDQIDAAMARYREAIKYMPDYPEALEGLANLELKQGEKK